jgi:hypothetical protein
MSNANTSDVNMPIPELEAVLNSLQRGEIRNINVLRNKRTARVPVIEMALDRVAEAVQSFGEDVIPTEPLDEKQYEAAKASFPLNTCVQALDTSIAIIKTLKGGPRNSLPKIWPKGRKVVPHVERITSLRREIDRFMEPIEAMHRKWHGIIDAKMAAAKPIIDKAVGSASTALVYHKAVTASYKLIKQGLIAGAEDWWAGAAKRMNVNAPLAMLDELVEKESVIPEYKNRSIELGGKAFELTEVKITQVEEAEKLEDITKKNVALRNEAYEVASISVHMDKLWAQVETAKDLAACLNVGRFPTVEYSANEISSLQAKIRKKADELPEAYAATTARFKKALADVHWKKAMTDVQANFAGAVNNVIILAGQYKRVQIRSVAELERELGRVTVICADLGTAVKMCEGGVKYENADELRKTYEDLEAFRQDMVEIEAVVPGDMERLTYRDVSRFSDAMNTAECEHPYGPGYPYFRNAVSAAEKVLAGLHPKIRKMKAFTQMAKSGLDPRLMPLVDSFGGVSGSEQSISQASIGQLEGYRKEIDAHETVRRRPGRGFSF